MKSRFVLLAAASTSLLLLSACGGGSSDAADPTSSSVAINDGNQSGVARATMSGGLRVAGVSPDSVDDRATAQSVGGAPAPLAASVVDAALRRALGATAIRRPRIASALARAADVHSTSTACGAGGTSSTIWDDHDNSGAYSAGDVVTVTFSQCDDGTGSKMDGTFVLTLDSGSTDTSFVASATYQNITYTSASTTFHMNGTLVVSETGSDTEQDDTLAIGSNGLTVTIASPTYDDTIVYDTGLQIASKTLTTPAATQVTIDGTFTSTSIGGSVTLATLQPIVELDSDPYPTSGQIRVTGANGSNLLLTVLGDSQVQIQLDANGDDVYESTTDVAWSALLT